MKRFISLKYSKMSYLSCRAHHGDPGWSRTLHQQGKHHQPDLSGEVRSRTTSHHALEPQPGGESPSKYTMLAETALLNLLFYIIL